MRFVQFYFGLPLAMVVLIAVFVPHLLPAEGLHRLRVPGEPLRPEDAPARRLPVPGPARPRRRHHDLRAGDHPVDGAGLVAGPDQRGHGRARHRLHRLGRDPGGQPDPEAADGRDAGRHGRGLRRSSAAAARRSPSATRLHIAGALGKMNVVDFSFNSAEPLHLLVRHHRRLLPGAVLLRDRPVAGAALPVGALDHREPAGPAVQRPAQDPDAVPHPVRRRDGLRVLPVHQPPLLLQRRRRWTRVQRPPQRARRCARWRPAHAGRLQPRSRPRSPPSTPPIDRRRPRRTPRPRPAPQVSRPRRRVGRPSAGEAQAAGRQGRCPAPRPRTPTTSSSRFVMQLPARSGLVGLLLAVIFCAAMSLDRQRALRAGDDHRGRLLQAQPAPARHRPALPARGQAVHRRSGAWWRSPSPPSPSLLDNLIQAVNILGSLFYGTILGIFLVGFFVRRVRGTPVFVAALAVRGAGDRRLPAHRRSASSGTTSSAARLVAFLAFLLDLVWPRSAAPTPAAS